MKGIYWIASYPKSGNTWFRIFLTNLRCHEEAPADFNQLDTSIASSRLLFDQSAGTDAADLLPDEVDRLRPRVYEQLVETAEETIFMKIHDAYTQTDQGEPLVSNKATLGAVYIVRNPLDVAVSYAHHSRISIDETIRQMGDPKAAFCSKPKRLHSQLRQKLMTWSGHVTSWVDAPGVNIHVIRYEDMLEKPQEIFSRAAAFCGLEDDPDKIARAVRFSSYTEIKKQEEQKRFMEAPFGVPSFFRKGEAGGFKEVLTAEQIGQIIRDHGSVMARFGYIDKAGV